MDTRQQIIQAACQIFYKKGFHACGVELLAQQAGVTKRTLYAHFGSKDALITAVLDYRHEQFITKMQSALNRQTNKRPDHAYLDFIVAWTHEPNFSGCLFIHACAEFGDTQSAPNQAAVAHKRQIRNILCERLITLGVENAQTVADTAFLIGEGMIAVAQTGQKNLINLLANDLKPNLIPLELTQ